jgi:hypothetical protein
MEEKIIELSGAGVPHVVIAATVGCDPSYVSQILATEEAQRRVGELRAGKAAKMIEHDDSIEGAEKIALEKIHRLLPMQTDIMKVTQVFRVLNGAKKASSHGMVGSTMPTEAVVTLELPEAARIHFRMTSDRQVIDIEGRSMVPMQSHQVVAELRKMQAKRLLESAQIVEQVPMVTQRTKSIVESL